MDRGGLFDRNNVAMRIEHRYDLFLINHAPLLRCTEINIGILS
jgi:hypothetical protein